MSQTYSKNARRASDTCQVNIKNGHRAEARDLRMRNQARRAEEMGRFSRAEAPRKCTEKTEGAEPS
eukprot:2794689-Karenia_brevis.AAC.1